LFLVSVHTLCLLLNADNVTFVLSAAIMDFL